MTDSGRRQDLGEAFDASLQTYHEKLADHINGPGDRPRGPEYVPCNNGPRKTVNGVDFGVWFNRYCTEFFCKKPRYYIIAHVTVLSVLKSV